MTDRLAILVSTDRHLDYVVQITAAAHEKGKKVSLFFTGRGVLLTLAPEFKALAGMAELAICDISFRSYGLHGRENEIPGLDRRDFVSQSRNAQMLCQADRYLVF